MDPVEVSAMFAAYVWCININKEGTAAEAVSFARDNWQAFLSNAHKGLGFLLIRLAAARAQRGRGGKRAAKSIAE